MPYQFGSDGQFQEDILAGLIEEMSLATPLEGLSLDVGIEVPDFQELLNVDEPQQQENDAVDEILPLVIEIIPNYKI